MKLHLAVGIHKCPSPQLTEHGAVIPEDSVYECSCGTWRQAIWLRTDRVEIGQRTLIPQVFWHRISARRGRRLAQRYAIAHTEAMKPLGQNQQGPRAEVVTP